MSDEIHEALVFRACACETPLWAFPNLVAGRWDQPGVWPAQYVSLHPMTPWAELLRNLHLRTPEQARELRVPIWALRLRLAQAPLEIGFADAEDFGLSPEDLVDDDRRRCQERAGALIVDGYRSIIVPSAALPGTSNMVIFDPAVVIDYHAEPLGEEDWPTAMVAQEGRCPEGLWDAVHHRGSATPHAGLQAFRDGGPGFVFEQPPVSAASLAA